MINYIKGDATEPQGNENGVNIIVHCCNDMGAWGAGFVLALSKKWPQVEDMYRNWFKVMDVKLGDIQPVVIDDSLIVVNMIGQHKIYSDKQHISPVRYDAFFRGLTTLVGWSGSLNGDVHVHMPRMGAGLAGGDWGIIEAIINATLIKSGIPVTVYDFE